MCIFHRIGLGHDASYQRMLMFVMPLLLTAIATGCGPRVLPITKITVACPGFSAVES